MIGIKLDFVSPTQKSQQSIDFVEMLKRIDVSCLYFFHLSTSFQAMGFDFIELAGGRYDKLEGQLLPELQQTKIFLTGGFKQVELMVRVVENGNADAVGLGRAVTGEPGKPSSCLLLIRKF